MYIDSRTASPEASKDEVYPEGDTYLTQALGELPSNEVHLQISRLQELRPGRETPSDTTQTSTSPDIHEALAEDRVQYYYRNRKR